MRIDENRLRRITRQILKEEVSESDVRSIINNKLDSSEFKKKVKEIMADSISELFKELYYRDNVWKSAIKK